MFPWLLASIFTITRFIYGEYKTMSIEDNKLKPCPFCGSSNTRLSKESGNMDRFIICKGCYARSSSFINEFDSIESWNNINQDRESLVNEIKALIEELNGDYSHGNKFQKQYINQTIVDLENIINKDSNNNEATK